MAGPLFRGVRAARFAGTDLGGVRGVAWEIAGRERLAGADDQAWLSLAALTGWSARIELSTDFPEAALAAFAPGAEGELSFVLEGVGPGPARDLKVTLAAAELVALAAAPRHGPTAAGGRLVFRAVSADGAASPVSTEEV